MLAPPHSLHWFRWRSGRGCAAVCAPVLRPPLHHRVPPLGPRLPPPSSSAPGADYGLPPLPTSCSIAPKKCVPRSWFTATHGCVAGERSAVMIEHDAAGMLTEGLGSIQSDVAVATEMILELSEVLRPCLLFLPTRNKRSCVPLSSHVLPRAFGLVCILSCPSADGHGHAHATATREARAHECRNGSCRPLAPAASAGILLLTAALPPSAHRLPSAFRPCIL
jgi:hypothetical protein